jgi:hypothetical protein
MDESSIQEPDKARSGLYLKMLGFNMVTVILVDGNYAL